MCCRLVEFIHIHNDVLSSCFAFLCTRFYFSRDSGVSFTCIAHSLAFTFAHSHFRTRCLLTRVSRALFLTLVFLFSFAPFSFAVSLSLCVFIIYFRFVPEFPFTNSVFHHRISICFLNSFAPCCYPFVYFSRKFSFCMKAEKHSRRDSNPQSPP